MNATRIARWGIVIAALCTGLGFAAGRQAQEGVVATGAAAPDPLAAETLPIPAPEPAGDRRATAR